MHEVVLIFVVAFSIRLISLIPSLKNERRLKAEGGKEFGKANSIVLSVLHFTFYFSCLTEAIILRRETNVFTFLGIGLFIFSITMLWCVIFVLKDIWTIKLIIAKNHPVNKNWLFRKVKHPNYYLNIIPELISIALICQAWHILSFGLPLYLISLFIRIKQENCLMANL